MGCHSSAKVKKYPPGIRTLPSPLISARVCSPVRFERRGRTCAQSSQSRATFGQDRVPMHVFVVVAQLCMDTALYHNIQLLIRYILETRMDGGRNTAYKLHNIRNGALVEDMVCYIGTNPNWASSASSSPITASPLSAPRASSSSCAPQPRTARSTSPHRGHLSWNPPHSCCWNLEHCPQ